MNNYWEERYLSGGKIWGDIPSISVLEADKNFSRYSFRRIHIPGCGYGRNAGFFINKGYVVSGSEISATACRLAGEKFPSLKLINCSMLEENFIPGSIDAVYAFNDLHLFKLDERLKLISIWSDMIKFAGMIFCTVFSELEDSFGKGAETEDNTFETKPGRPVHYFTKDDLVSHFKNLTHVKDGIFDEPEDHDGKHIHKLRYIILKKEK
ncbi:MAG: class I SAM-dependent methyltransferase [Spirochaetes bacterium]|nr:class I SAM-dependent methyltransferase [Spirochaetota bacterium]